MLRKRWNIIPDLRLRLAGKLNGWARRIAAWIVPLLQRQEAKLNRNQKITCLVVFCLVFSGSSAWVMYRALDADVSSVPFHLPRFNPPRLRLDRSRPFLSRQDSLQIKNFRHMVDSLQQTENGKKLLLEFAQRHPGLLDSFLTMEKLIY